MWKNHKLVLLHDSNCHHLTCQKINCQKIIFIATALFYESFTFRWRDFFFSVFEMYAKLANVVTEYRTLIIQSKNQRIWYIPVNVFYHVTLSAWLLNVNAHYHSELNVDSFIFQSSGIMSLVLSIQTFWFVNRNAKPHDHVFMLFPDSYSVFGY